MSACSQAASAWFISDRIDRGWAPPDEGLLGQTAERFLGGEVPHRDFDDLYTGGLTVLHGAAFAMLGTKMSSLRIVLLGAVVLWIPFVWLICALTGLAVVPADEKPGTHIAPDPSGPHGNSNPAEVCVGMVILPSSPRVRLWTPWEPT